MKSRHWTISQNMSTFFLLQKNDSPLSRKEKVRVACIYGLAQLHIKMWKDAIACFEWALNIAEGRGKVCAHDRL